MSRLVGGQTPEPATPMDLLADRELRVFILTGEGLGPSEITEKLHLSVKTIETCRSRIKEKLDLKSATELRRNAIHWVQNCDLKEALLDTRATKKSRPRRKPRLSTTQSALS